MFIGVGGVWLAWLAGWINRVELQTAASPMVQALGLRFEREGWRSRIVARGDVAGVPVVVRWSAGTLGRRAWWSIAGGPWEEVAADDALADRLRARVAAG